MRRQERQVREHWRPDDDDLRDETSAAAAERPFRFPTTAQRRANWIVPLVIPILSLILILLLMTGCEIGAAIGLPNNDECRDVETSPGDPISQECLDTVGQPAASP
jgi:hypothetical protein